MSNFTAEEAQTMHDIGNKVLQRVFLALFPTEPVADAPQAGPHTLLSPDPLPNGDMCTAHGSHRRCVCLVVATPPVADRCKDVAGNLGPEGRSCPH